jgi:hypothetical protein
MYVKKVAMPETLQEPSKFDSLEANRSEGFIGPVLTIADRVMKMKTMPAFNPLMQKDMSQAVQKELVNIHVNEEILQKIFLERSTRHEMRARLERRQAAEIAYFAKRDLTDEAIKEARAELALRKAQALYQKMKMAEALALLLKKDHEHKLMEEIRAALVADVKLNMYYLEKAQHTLTDRAEALVEEVKLARAERFKDMFLKKEAMYFVKLEKLNLMVAAHEAAVQYGNLQVYEKTLGSKPNGFEPGKINALKNGKSRS